MLRTLRRLLGGARPKPAPLPPLVLPPLTTPPLKRVHNFSHPLVWAARDPQKTVAQANELLKGVESGYYFGDNLLTWGRNLSALDDTPFMEAWRTNIESPSDETILWRRYILACAAFHAVQLDGDFVECGAYTGVGVKTVMDYLGGPTFPKTFWAYDVFDHDPSMLNPAMPAHGPPLHEHVVRKFEAYPQVRVVRGTIPTSFADACPERIAYLHIDLNQATAEIAALDHLFERLVPGAMLVLDDYEWGGTYRPQKLAEDVWFDARGYRVMPLPTGQGLVFKR